MKRALLHLAANNRVVQVVSTEQEFDVAQGLIWVDCPDVVTTEYTYNPETGVFSPPIPPAPVIPTEISMRQARLALLSQGLLSQVNAAIGSLPEQQRLAAEIEWEYATSVKRTSSLVVAISQSLGLNGSDLDSLFALGSSL